MKTNFEQNTLLLSLSFKGRGFKFAHRVLWLFFILLSSFNGFTQVQNSALVARFGIDGDLYSDIRQNGSFTAAGSDDWFKTNNGTGIGIIDTTGAAALKTSLAAGNNLAFIKYSSIPRFSIIDTFLHLDGIYGRDYSDNDKTSFTTGSKNGVNPSSWTTTPTGGSVQDKSDIIDVFAMLRRNGLSINAANPSPLILTMGSIIAATTGSRYVDFELFVNRISYDTITGIFSNSGPAAKGGHEDFQFNTDGSLNKIGDMNISYTYSSTVVTDISIYIWVNINVYQNTFGQQNFNFVPGEFYGSGSGATFGYAKIVAKAGKTLPLWGTVNSATTAGPSWGTVSKDLGGAPSKYYSLNIGVGQFSEIGVNLSSIGIDPAFNNISGNTCNPPFTRIMIKTRTSASFSSALADFAGPYAFLDAPIIPANILSPQVLSCSKLSVSLSPVNIDNSAYYLWSTSNGNIVGKKDTTVISINKPGKYYLSTSIGTGCSQNKDSVVVSIDNYKPVATAHAVGTINQGFTNTVQLLGGDTSQSNYSTPFGNSQGLFWNWSNGQGFSSSIQNPLTPDTGWHRLIVTEKRNGCKDTANTYVLWYNDRVLKNQFQSITATAIPGGYANIQWMMKNEDGFESYNLQRSEDGINFSTIYQVSAQGLNSSNIYRYTDNILQRSAAVIYYRVKIISTGGFYFYTPQAKLIAADVQHAGYLIEAYQQSSRSIAVNYFCNEAGPVTINLLDMQGRIISKADVPSQKGVNRYVYNNPGMLPGKQLVLVQVIIENLSFIRKVLIQ